MGNVGADVMAQECRAIPALRVDGGRDGGNTYYAECVTPHISPVHHPQQSAGLRPFWADRTSASPLPLLIGVVVNTLSRRIS
jgi:hypothetical protein